MLKSTEILQIGTNTILMESASLQKLSTLLNENFSKAVEDILKINGRVVITGIGALTPIGNTVDEFWTNLTNGVSGAVPISHFDTTKFKTHFACEINGFNPLEHFERSEIRKYDLF